MDLIDFIFQIYKYLYMSETNFYVKSNSGSCLKNRASASFENMTWAENAMNLWKNEEK